MQLCNSSTYSTVPFLPFVSSHYFFVILYNQSQMSVGRPHNMSALGWHFLVLWDFYVFTWFCWCTFYECPACLMLIAILCSNCYKVLWDRVALAICFHIFSVEYWYLYKIFIPANVFTSFYWLLVKWTQFQHHLDFVYWTSEPACFFQMFHSGSILFRLQHHFLCKI